MLGIPQHASWPPPPGAVTPAGAVRRGDASLHFAWSTAAAIEPWVEGTEFFPRIFADAEAARTAIHILMFGWREGEVGMQLAGLLERKLAAGVEVRAIVDGFGTVKLDAWALYRNAEIMMIARSAEAAALLEERLFEPDIARARRGEPPSGPGERALSRLSDKLTYHL